MTVRYTSMFRKQYGGLSDAIQRKVDKAIEFLDTDFRYPGLRSHPLKSHPGIFEAYVDDKYRMTFERQGDTLIMRNVNNHDECLKNP
jgi:mRNA-degrading endonuclease YafQ of YafQ-DinJ toxin-antitoxin module